MSLGHLNFTALQLETHLTHLVLHEPLFAGDERPVCTPERWSPCSAGFGQLPVETHQPKRNSAQVNHNRR